MVPVVGCEDGRWRGLLMCSESCMIGVEAWEGLVVVIGCYCVLLVHSDLAPLKGPHCLTSFHTEK